MPFNPFYDFFDDPSSWTVYASGLSEGRLVHTKGYKNKSGLRLDYDFHGGGGYIVIRKEVQRALPDTFEFSFHLKGKGSKNRLEFKISDPGGADVWRFLQEDWNPTNQWERMTVRERDLRFAWGPEGGGAPVVIGSIEFAIAAGSGGKGTIYFSDLSMEDQTLYLPVHFSASSHHPNYPPRAVFEQGSPSGWRAVAGDPDPYWCTDFGRINRFGGMIITWPIPMPPREFEIESSRDGLNWIQIFKASHAMGLRTHVPAQGAEARYVRIKFANAAFAAIGSLELKADTFSHTQNDFLHAVACDFPRGWFPRYWHHEQSYWTPIGCPEGKKRGLINEEGLVEVDEGGFSLEPFLLLAGNLITWAEADISLSFPRDGVPFPEVTWIANQMTLRVIPWVDGTGESLTLRVTYEVVNMSGHEVRFVIAARPYQVNPPWQAFRNLGGASHVHHVKCEHGYLLVEGRQVIPDLTPDECGAAAFEEDGVVEFLSRGMLPFRSEVYDNSNLASGAMAWQLPIGDKTFRVTISVPFYGKSDVLTENARQDALIRWREMLSPVKWTVPSSVNDAVACFRTAACHILINRDGTAIQPGPRRYTRSWVRDCVIIGTAMMKAGAPEILRSFVLWYAKFQREDGFVPAVVDRDGVDWIIEHDSHGQLIWGIHEGYQGPGDEAFLIPLWPHVRSAAEYLLTLRSSRMTLEFTDPEYSACYGLLPESASHEGYLAHPVHSYWDNFWGVRGLEAAGEIAEAMGQHDDAKRWRGEAMAFLGATLQSIDKVIRDRNIDYIPGSVEWADFDPTATANAIAQLDFADTLPAGPLNRMLDTYLDGFRRKHRGMTPWLNYSAYEIRIIGAFVRLGRREEAFELLTFFLNDRRPLLWNQWPEITWRDPRSPGHLGDIPHTWIAAEYMLAFASMVASEREATEELLLAAGLPWEWIAEDAGFGVHGLVTRFGPLDFNISAPTNGSILAVIGAGITIPIGGVTIAPPLLSGMQILSAVNEHMEFLPILKQGTAVQVESIPVTITMQLGPATIPTILT